MYLIIYKTTHTNGRYYIGRHQTDNLNDGYLGSGKWISSIKDKSLLTRKIIAEAKDFDELCWLEEQFISHHFNDPLCMNIIIGSNGWSSEDATRNNIRRVEKGSHPFLGSNINDRMLARGTHSSQTLIANGTHKFLIDNPSHKRVAKGTHNFQTNPTGRQQWKNGTHYWKKDIHPSKKMVISLETGYITNIVSKTKHDRKTGMRHTWLPI